MAKKAKEQKLTTEELGEIQGLQQKMYALKVRLGDTVIEQKNTMAQIDSIQAQFKSKEVELIKIYGENAQINLQTGVVTPEAPADLKKKHNMARISDTNSYPNIVPDGEDYLILTDKTDALATKTATLNSISSFFASTSLQSTKVTLSTTQLLNLFPLQLL